MNDEEFQSLLTLLYDGVTSPQNWTLALTRLASVTHSQAASLVLWSRQTNQAVVGEQVGLPGDLVAAYAQHYHLLDPGRGHVDRINTGDWYIDERELGAASMRRHPFYREFLARYGLDSTMASPYLRSPDGMEGFISLSASAGTRDLAAVARSLAPLMPHVRRAAALRLKLDEVARQARLHEDVFDRLNFPVVVVGTAATVAASNRLGSAWLAQPGNPLAAGSRESARVAALVKVACGVGVPRRAAGTRLRKPSGAEYYLTAVPLPPRDGWAGQSPMALLVVSDPGQGRRSSADLLRQIFGLTPAEIRLVERLQQGLPMTQACELLHISPHTARTQLQSVFGKLGIQRQADIVRVLGQMDVVVPND